MIEMIVRYAALILSSLEIEITNKALVHFSSMIVNFLNDFFNSLKGFMMEQRRIHPSYLDLQLLMKSFKVAPGELLYQYELGQLIRKSQESTLEKLNKQSKEILDEINYEPKEEDELMKNDKDFIESSKLNPSTNHKRNYIQGFLPAFPPDHTYKNSEIFTEKIQDPKKLRQILVNEGNYALMNLLKLQDPQGDDDNNKILNEINDDGVLQLLSPPMSPIGELPKETGNNDIEKLKSSINLPTKPLNIEEYASKRLQMKDKKLEKKIIKVNKLRTNERFVKNLIIQKHLSPYKSSKVKTDVAVSEQDLSPGDKSNFPINAKVGEMINDNLNSEFNFLIKNLRIQKTQKKKRFEEKLELKKKILIKKQEKIKELELQKQQQNHEQDLDFDNFEFGFEEEENVIVEEKDLMGEESKFENGTLSGEKVEEVVKKDQNNYFDSTGSTKVEEVLISNPGEEIEINIEENNDNDSLDGLLDEEDEDLNAILMNSDDESNAEANNKGEEINIPQNILSNVGDNNDNNGEDNDDDDDDDEDLDALLEDI